MDFCVSQNWTSSNPVYKLSIPIWVIGIFIVVISHWFQLESFLNKIFILTGLGSICKVQCYSKKGSPLQRGAQCHTFCNIWIALIFLVAPILGKCFSADLQIFSSILFVCFFFNSSLLKQIILVHEMLDQNVCIYILITATTYQCFEDFLLEGEGGSRKNYHEFPFLNNIERLPGWILAALPIFRYSFIL